MNGWHEGGCCLPPGCLLSPRKSIRWLLQLDNLDFAQTTFSKAIPPELPCSCQLPNKKVARSHLQRCPHGVPWVVFFGEPTFGWFQGGKHQQAFRPSPLPSNRSPPQICPSGFLLRFLSDAVLPLPGSNTRKRSLPSKGF